MSRLYNPECSLEADNHDRRHGRQAFSPCELMAPGGQGDCCAPRDHPGNAHIHTGHNGTVVIMRWTDAGTIQEPYEQNWTSRFTGNW